MRDNSQYVGMTWTVFGVSLLSWILLMMFAPNESLKSVDIGWNSYTVFYYGLFVIVPMLVVAILVTIAGAERRD